MILSDKHVHHSRSKQTLKNHTHTFSTVTHDKSAYTHINKDSMRVYLYKRDREKKRERDRKKERDTNERRKISLSKKSSHKDTDRS